jgi:hypothetical protein
VLSTGAALRLHRIAVGEFEGSGVFLVHLERILKAMCPLDVLGIGWIDERANAEEHVVLTTVRVDTWQDSVVNLS